MTTVKLPPLNALAVDIVGALFRYTIGDVEAVSEEALVFKVDLGQFKNKLSKFAARADSTGGRYFGLLGGMFANRYCGVEKVQDLAGIAAQDPKDLIAHISHVEVIPSGNSVRIRWGFPPYIGSEAAPPIVASIEFVEGARTWPAAQLMARGSGKRKTVTGGYVREVEISCRVLGAIALGMGAAYVAGSQRGGEIRLLIPLTVVEYNVGEALRYFLEGVQCDLPEFLLRLAVASFGERPAVYKYVMLKYTGGKEVEKDASYEITLDTTSLRGASLILRDYRSALSELARQWCRCDAEGWQGDVCKEVEVAAEAFRSLYLFLEGGFYDEAHKALSRVYRLKSLTNIRNALVEIVTRVV